MNKEKIKKENRFWKVFAILFLIMAIFYMSSSLTLSQGFTELEQENQFLKNKLNELNKPETAKIMCVQEDNKLMCKQPIQSKPMCYK